MMSHVAAFPDLIKNYFIPAESKIVRYCMRKAEEMSRCEDFVYGRFFPVLFATVSVWCSFFNGISYVLQVPIDILLNLVSYSPLNLIKDLVMDIFNGARSFLFVGMGVALVFSGLIFPREVFSRFAPEDCLSQEEKRASENEELRGKVTELNGTIEQLRNGNVRHKQIVEELEAQLEAIAQNGASHKNGLDN